jgi:hypothetical protein
VFVDPAADAGDGTQALPFPTLTDALTNNPEQLPIYVCSTSSEVDEAITLVGTERIVGGLSCVNWQPTANKTPWTSPENTIPLTLANTTAAHVQGFVITARAADGWDDDTYDGNDSIAVMADGAIAKLVHVDLIAGAGAPGGDAENLNSQAPGQQSAPAAFDAVDAGGCGTGPSPAPFYGTCPAGGFTSGGPGGNPGTTNGSPGLAGVPDPLLGEPDGDGGYGDDGSSTWDCYVNKGHGEYGHDGPNGVVGPGGTGTGTISAAGLHGAAGGDGMPGGIGQGGGGGGGVRAGWDTNCPNSTYGRPGGSGGAGGCGGFGGVGGGAGGASIALVSLGSILVLTDVVLTAASGGSGGAGGGPQFGGQGGRGGSSYLGCDGGDGGTGGTGGPGGGGAGGPSIGLAFTGDKPTISDADITVAETPASGGPGGFENLYRNAGAEGVVIPQQEF